MNFEAKTNTSPLDQWSLGMTTIDTYNVQRLTHPTLVLKMFGSVQQVA